MLRKFAIFADDMRFVCYILLVFCVWWGLSGCSDDVHDSETGLRFDRFDIVHSIDGAPDDAFGRVNPERMASVQLANDVVYLERDRVFLNQDKSGKYYQVWSLAPAFGSYNGKGIKPRQGQTYTCRQTGQRYIADSEGRLIPAEEQSITFTVMTWNIGCFNHGHYSSFSITDNEKYQALLADFNEFFSLHRPDVIGLCEFLPEVVKKRKIRSDLFAPYPFAATSRLTTEFLGKALFSQFKLFNSAQIRTEERILLEAEMLLSNGETVLVCICHAPWQEEANWDELKLLAHRYEYVPRVILMGDFNVLESRADESWKLFTNVGFKAANDGSIPTTFSSSICSVAIDNILVKGGDIIDVEVPQNTPPGLDPLQPSVADDAQWEQYNLSDHFPLIATIRFPE